MPVTANIWRVGLSRAGDGSVCGGLDFWFDFFMNRFLKPLLERAGYLRPTRKSAGGRQSGEFMRRIIAKTANPSLKLKFCICPIMYPKKHSSYATNCRIPLCGGARQPVFDQASFYTMRFIDRSFVRG